MYIYIKIASKIIWMWNVITKDKILFAIIGNEK